MFQEMLAAGSGGGSGYSEYIFDASATVSGTSPTTIETFGKVNEVYVGIVRTASLSDEAGIRLKGDGTVFATMTRNAPYIAGKYDTSSYSTVTMELFSMNGYSSPSGKFGGFVLYK